MVTKVEYDESVDCGYLYLRPISKGGVSKSRHVQIAQKGVFGSLVIDIDRHGHVVGIEVLGVSTIMPDLIKWAAKR